MSKEIELNVLNRNLWQHDQLQKTPQLKQAILITAYHQLHHLFEISDSFDDRFSFYVHIDKRTRVSNEIKNKIESDKRIHVYQQLSTYWGSFNHLRSLFFLAEKALADNQNFYFHFISGHDMPIKNSSQFFEKFNESKAGFLDWFEVKGSQYESEWLSRLQYRGVYNWVNVKNGWGRKLNNACLLVQMKRGLKQMLPTHLKLFGGMAWSSMRRDCLQYLVDFRLNDKEFWPTLTNMFCAEEVYPHTVLLNSKFANEIVNNNLRFADWKFVNGNKPANLDLSYGDKLIASDFYFARRMHYPVSLELVNFLKEQVMKS